MNRRENGVDGKKKKAEKNLGVENIEPSLKASSGMNRDRKKKGLTSRDVNRLSSMQARKSVHYRPPSDTKKKQTRCKEKIGILGKGRRK